jgi:hypothetical protein
MSDPASVAGPRGDLGPAELLLAEVVEGFRAQKRAGDAALAQLEDDDWQRRLDEESNSVAVLVRHLDGNMRSRWSEFLTSDGEKPTRQRDAEFEDATAAPDELLAIWERGWSAVFAAIEPLTPDDLARVVPIRGEPHSVARALLRQLTHYAQHVGQIVLLAKHLRGPAWRTLSIPRRRPPA